MSRIVNSVLNISRQVNFKVATIITGVTIDVYKPDGTIVLNGPASVAPGTSNILQTLSAQIIFDQLGKWVVNWKPVLPGGEIPLLQDVYFVAISDIWAMCRDDFLSGKTEQQLPDAVLEPLFAYVTQELEINTPVGIGGYRTLTGSDPMWFERGVAGITAAKLRIYNPEKFPVGPIRMDQKGLIRKMYYDDATRSKFPGFAANTVESLLIEAYNSLNNVTAIASDKAVFDSQVSTFALAGPKRGLYAVQSQGYMMDYLWNIASSEHLPKWL